MATLLDKERSYTNVEKTLLVYNGCDAGENPETFGASACAGGGMDFWKR